MTMAVDGCIAPQSMMVRDGYVRIRSEILDDYRKLRIISVDHHSGALKLVARATLIEQARRLGWAASRTLIVDSEAELTLVFDLAIYTAKQGRSRALDRYAKSMPAPARTDEARVLAAMREAIFSIWEIRRFHETAGVMVADVLRENEVWLMDEGLEQSGCIGVLFASCLFFTDSFAMTSGVVVPVTEDVVDDALRQALAWRYQELPMVAQDPRFAAAIYRAALDDGIVENVVYHDLSPVAAA